MWEMFVGMPAGLTPPALPPAVVETVRCQPGYVYSDWQFESESRRFVETWVVAYYRYTRTKTDICTGVSVTEQKTEGPYRLWPAVPHQYVETVNRPTGTTTVSGSPLLSTDPVVVGGPVQVGPAPSGAVRGDSPQARPMAGGKVPQPFDMAGYVLLAGALAFTVAGRRLLPPLLPSDRATGPGRKGNGDQMQGGSASMAGSGETMTGGTAGGGAWDGPVSGGPLWGEGHGSDGAAHPITPILSLEGATRDPGMVGGDGDGPGTRGAAKAPPVVEIEGVRREEGNRQEMSNTANHGDSWVGGSPLICTPTAPAPVRDALLTEADRGMSKLGRFLQLTTGGDANEWSNFRELSTGRRLGLISSGLATVASFGGTALVRKGLENPKVAKVASVVGNFALELLTGGNVEQWKNFGQQSFWQKAWMVGNSLVTLATVVVPVAWLGKLAPVLKWAGGLIPRAFVWAKGTWMGKGVAAVFGRIAASRGGQLTAGAARWLYRTTGMEAVVSGIKGAHGVARDVALTTYQELIESRVVPTMRRYGEKVAEWLSNKGLRHVADYLEIDPRNPLLRRAGYWVASKFGNLTARRSGTHAAKSTGSKVARWFWDTPLGRLVRDSKLTPWHLRDDLAEVSLEGADNLIEAGIESISKRTSKGRIPAGSAKAQELSEHLESLRTPVRYLRERVATREIKEKSQGGIRTMEQWLGPRDTWGHD